MFWKLLFYEYKKMWKRKTVWFSLIGAYLVVWFSTCTLFLGDVYVEGGRACTMQEYEEACARAAKELEGKKMDQALFEQYARGYEEYAKLQPGTDFTAADYLRVQETYLPSILLEHWKAAALVPDGSKSVYEDRAASLLKTYENQHLSAQEIRWHQKEIQETGIITYSYNEGANRFIQLQASTLLFTAIAVVIAAAPLFAEEYSLKTDSFLLSSRYGRKKAAAAKLTAGFSYTVLVSLLYFLTSFFMQMEIYGTGDFQAAAQTMICMADKSYSLTVGQAVAAIFVCGILSQCLLAAVVMLCSSRMNAPFAPVILGLVLAIVPMFGSIFPQDQGLLSVLFYALPSSFGTAETVFCSQLLSLGSLCIPAYLFVPVGCLLLLLLLSLLSKSWFCRHEAG